ncbi:MAG: DUF4347 domain-containing protein, partial [Trichodesmium sp. St16_bin4-tuft]|nr:DUF4347 domain-containing protein [Trichodesmium sp. St16_bin4-tuft]
MKSAYSINNHKLVGNWEQEVGFWKVSAPLQLFNSEPELRTSFSTNNNSRKLWGVNPITDIVFIDSQIEDYESLVNGALSGVKVVILNSIEDGVEQITKVIGKYLHLSSVHIVSHGRPGCLFLGNGQLSLDNINNSYTSDLEGWSVSNLLLYGCNVAAGDGGREFLETLHGLTGANIAATAGLTGSLALGGDWELEVIRGELEVDVPFTRETQEEWNYVLTAVVSINAAGTPAEAGAARGIFTIDRGEDTGGDLIVFFTISGTAQQNIDYDIQGVRTLENTVPTVTFNGGKGSVVIPDGQARVDMKIVPREDIVTDGEETVTLTLTEAPTGAAQQYDVSSTPGDETATLTITDNTNPPSKKVGVNEIVISDNANGAYSVFAADVDGDGDMDVLSASINDDKIALYLNDGSNNFTEQTISTNADGAISVFAADVDGDGDMDVLSASYWDNKIALHLNDGSNNFTEQIISNNARGAESVFAADVDSDGDVDVLSASFNDSKIALYLNDGSNNFTEQTISTNADGAQSVFAADVDGDGDVDVLSASERDDK